MKNKELCISKLLCIFVLSVTFTVFATGQGYARGWESKKFQYEPGEATPKNINSWYLLNGPYGQIVNCFDVSLSNPNVLYATSPGTPPAIYKSIDAGATWTNVCPDAPTNSAQIVVDHFDENLVYTFESFYGTMGVSTDGGQTWNGHALADWFEDYVGGTMTMSADPINPGGLYIGTDTGKIVYLEYLNDTATVLGEIYGVSRIRELYISPNPGGRMFAGVISVDKIYYSDDGGANWLPAESGPDIQCDVINIIVDPINSNIVYATTSTGLYRSIDDGENFSLFALSGYYLRTILVDPRNPAILYVSESAHFGEDDSQGVWKSIDRGKTWEVYNNGILEPSVTHLAFNPQNQDELYASTTMYRLGNYTGFYKSTNAAKLWEPHNIGMRPRFWDLQVHPTDSHIIFAASDYGLFKSIDAGASWSYNSKGMPDHRISGYYHTIAIDPINPNTMYVSTSAVEGLNGGLVKSIDGGETWELKKEGAGQSLAIDPQNPNIVFFAISYPTSTAGIYRSEDSGNTWERVNGGRGYALCVSPHNSQIVLASVYNRIIRSNDGGFTWVDSEMNGYDYMGIKRIQCHPTDPNLCYATSWGSGNWGGPDGAVLYSIDSGISWDMYMDIGFPQDLIIDVQNPNFQYVSSSPNGGVWLCDAQGQQYQPLNEGLDPERLRMAGIEDAGNALYVSWLYGGIYKRRKLLNNQIQLREIGKGSNLNSALK